jgi:hypothetical protein
MAFLDKLKGEIVDIIEWNEDGSDTVVCGQQSGPHDLAALATLAAAGRLDAATLAWRSGQQGWQPLGAIAELRSALGARTE